VLDRVAKHGRPPHHLVHRGGGSVHVHLTYLEVCPRAGMPGPLIGQGPASHLNGG
jgi:hypothetical protein